MQNNTTTSVLELISGAYSGDLWESLEDVLTNEDSPAHIHTKPLQKIYIQFLDYPLGNLLKAKIILIIPCIIENKIIECKTETGGDAPAST